MILVLIFLYHVTLKLAETSVVKSRPSVPYGTRLIFITAVIIMHLVCKMRPIAADEVAWSVCMSVCLSVSHIREPCQSRWTDWHATWNDDSRGSNKNMLQWGEDRMNPFASVMRPFAKLLYQLSVLVTDQPWYLLVLLFVQSRVPGTVFGEWT